MNNVFKKAVENAMVLGKKLICVSEPCKDLENPKEFMSLENFDDIGEAQDMLGLGTTDFMYLEEVFGTHYSILEIEKHYLNTGWTPVPSNTIKKENTQKFKEYYDKLYSTKVQDERHAITDEFLKNYDGTMIIVFNVTALGYDNSSNKTEWNNVLNAVASQYNGIIYKEELYK